MTQLRYNWGICTNRDMDGNGTPCPKCASKEKQRVINGHDFVCSECGERLSKVQPPKTPMQKLKPVIIAVIVVVVIAAIVAAIAFSGGSKDNAQPAVTDSTAVKTDSAATATTDTKQPSADQTAAQSAKADVQSTEQTEEVKTKVEKKTTTSTTTTSSSQSGSKNLGYAIFKGTLKGGVPDDVNGRLIFKTSHVIDSRDPKGRVADAGDYVIGEFSEGHLVQGIWYGSDNVVKGSIIIGK